MQIRSGTIPPKKYSTDIPIFWRKVRFARRSSGTGIASTKVLVIMFEMPEEYVRSVLRVHWANNLEAPGQPFSLFPRYNSVRHRGAPPLEFARLQNVRIGMQLRKSDKMQTAKPVKQST